MERLPAPRWRIPAFTSGHELFRGLAHYARPQEKLTVSQFAVRYQNYDPDIFPWQLEIMDRLSNAAVREVGLLGPVQTGKSTIGIAWTGRNVLCDPDDMQITLPTQQLSAIFSNSRVTPMIEKTKVVRDRLKPGPNAIQTYSKHFMGMDIYFSHPSPGEFTQRPIRYEWADDADQFPDDIGGSQTKDGQGSIHSLMQGRMTSFQGRSKLFISSTPADDNGGKTEAFVRSGTFERLHPECPQCGERWEIDAERDLKFESGSQPERAAKTAHVVCGTGNGCILQPKDKRKLLSSLNRLPNRGFISHNPEVGQEISTFWLDGLMCMSSWTEIAREWRIAEIAWAARQDEGPMRTLRQTKFGKNHRSILSGEKPLNEEDVAKLKDAGFKSGIVPAGPVVWTLSVDTQHNRFDCAAVGYCDGHESWLIHRWTLDVLDDGFTALQPFLKPEHWRVLLPLFDMTWEMEGGGRTPPPLCVAIDTGGGGDKTEATATENAKKFWRLAREAGVAGNRIMLLKGSSTASGELVRVGAFSDKKVKGTPQRSGPVLWLVNGHKIKNIMDVRLRRTEPGPGRIHLPEDLADEYLAELTAEEVVKGKWVKRRPRNETWDLIRYAWSALIKPPFAKSRDKMNWVPKAYRIEGLSILPTSEAASGQGEDAQPDRMPATPQTAEKNPVRPQTVRPGFGSEQRQDWIPDVGPDWY
jgi:phage terminase large subunit GpA-like protein